MFLDLSMASLGGILLSEEDERSQQFGSVLIGAAAWWMLRDLKETA